MCSAVHRRGGGTTSTSRVSIYADPVAHQWEPRLRRRLTERHRIKSGGKEIVEASTLTDADYIPEANHSGSRSLLQWTESTFEQAIAMQGYTLIGMSSNPNQIQWVYRDISIVQKAAAIESAYTHTSGAEGAYHKSINIRHDASPLLFIRRRFIAHTLVVPARG